MIPIRTAASIAAGIASAGMVATAIFAAKGGAKLATQSEKTKKDVLEAYAPAAAAGAVTLAAVGYLGYTTTDLGNKLLKEIASHALTVAVGQKAMAALEQKAAELIGPKKTRQLVDEHTMAEHEARTKAHNVPPLSAVEMDDLMCSGDTLCYDASSGRYFRSDSEFIRSVVNDLNEDIIIGGEVSFNDIYDALGLDHTTLGPCFTNKPYQTIEADFTTKLVESYGRQTPCLIVKFKGFDFYAFNE